MALNLCFKEGRVCHKPLILPVSVILTKSYWKNLYFRSSDFKDTDWQYRSSCAYLVISVQKSYVRKTQNKVVASCSRTQCITPAPIACIMQCFADGKCWGTLYCNLPFSSQEWQYHFVVMLKKLLDQHLLLRAAGNCMLACFPWKTTWTLT